MLKFLRNKKTQKRIYIGLTIAILPAFLFWGVFTSEESSDSSATLGLIDNHKITIRDYLAAYKSVQHELLLLYGNQSRQIASYLNIKGEAWDRLLLLDYAKAEKIKVNDEEVVAWLLQQPFLGKDGRFDAAYYKMYIKEYFRMQTRDFEEEIRKLLVIDKIRSQMRSKVSISDADLKEVYDLENGQRDIEYAVLPWESVKDKVFNNPTEIDQLYPLLKDKLTEAEKVKIKYIVVPKTADDAAKEIFSQKSLPLDELSKQFTIPLKESDFFTRNESISGIGLSNEISLASFTLAVNEESDWIHLEDASYKISVTEKKPERLLSLEESRNELEGILTKQKATELVTKKLEELGKKANSSTFADVFKEAGLEVQKAEKIQSGSYIPGIGPSDTIAKALLKLKTGDISQAFSIPSGAAIVLVTKNWPVDAKEFEKNKDTFLQKMESQKVKAEMDSLLEKLRVRLRINLELMKKLFAEDLPQNQPTG